MYTPNHGAITDEDSDPINRKSINPAKIENSICTDEKCNPISTDGEEISGLRDRDKTSDFIDRDKTPNFIDREENSDLTDRDKTPDPIDREENLAFTDRDETPNPLIGKKILVSQIGIKRPILLTGTSIE